MVKSPSSYEIWKWPRRGFVVAVLNCCNKWQLMTRSREWVVEQVASVCVFVCLSVCPHSPLIVQWRERKMGLCSTKCWGLLLSALGLALSGYALFVEIQAQNDENYQAMCDIDETISCSKYVQICFPITVDPALYSHVLYNGGIRLIEPFCELLQVQLSSKSRSN